MKNNRYSELQDSINRMLLSIKKAIDIPTQCAKTKNCMKSIEISFDNLLICLYEEEQKLREELDN